MCSVFVNRWILSLWNDHAGYMIPLSGVLITVNVVNMMFHSEVENEQMSFSSLHFLSLLSFIFIFLFCFIGVTPCLLSFFSTSISIWPVYTPQIVYLLSLFRIKLNGNSCDLADSQASLDLSLWKCYSCLIQLVVF